jgi:hypothetical protein
MVSCAHPHALPCRSRVRGLRGLRGLTSCARTDALEEVQKISDQQGQRGEKIGLLSCEGPEATEVTHGPEAAKGAVPAGALGTVLLPNVYQRSQWDVIKEVSGIWTPGP